MNKNNKKYLLIVVLLLLVIIGMGYAAIATNLSIQGNSTIEKASWDVHFENLIKSQGSVNADIEGAINESKTAVDYTVTLPEPGDFYEFTVELVNAGTIDAMISEVLNTSLTAEQQKYIEYSVTYSDGVELKEKDALASGKRETVKVRVKYRNDLNPEDLPTEDQSLAFAFQVTYVQDDGTGIER